MNCKGHPIGANIRSQGDRKGRPYYTTDRLGKPVYSRGDPCGRLFAPPSGLRPAWDSPSYRWRDVGREPFRRGGSGVEWGGDVCVAFVVPLCTRSPSSQSDASVPSPHDPTPAPTGTKRLPRRYHEIPTRESPTPAPTKVTIGPKLPTPVSRPLRV